LAKIFKSKSIDCVKDGYTDRLKMIEFRYTDVK